MSPQSVQAELYDQLNLTCEASSNAPVMYKWKKDGRIISSQVLANLLIPEVNPDDRGAYQCIASNGVSNASSNKGLVTIRGMYQ